MVDDMKLLYTFVRYFFFHCLLHQIIPVILGWKMVSKDQIHMERSICGEWWWFTLWFLGNKKFHGIISDQHSTYEKYSEEQHVSMFSARYIPVVFVLCIVYIYIYVTQKQQRMLREPQKYVAGLPVIDDFFVWADGVFVFKKKIPDGVVDTS